MIAYVYNGHITQVNLTSLGTEILLTMGSYIGYGGAEWSKGCNTTQKPPCTSNCQQPCNGLLVVFFTEELSTNDKAILDDIVSHY